MNRKIVGALAIITAALLWAIEGIVLLPKLYTLPVGVVVFFLSLFAFLYMHVFFLKEYCYLTRFTRYDFFTLGLIALFGGVLGTLAIVKALFLVNFQQLSVVLLLQKLQPVFTILLAMLLLKEKAGKHFWWWASLAIFASYPLTFGFHLPKLGNNNNIPLAAFYAIVAAASYGSATVFGRMMAKKYAFTTITFYRFGLSALFLLVYLLFTHQLIYSLALVQSFQWKLLLLIPLLTGLGGMFFYYFGLQRVKAMISTICELSFPVFSVLLDYMINGTLLSPVQLISAVVMVFAITMLTLEKNA